MAMLLPDNADFRAQKSTRDIHGPDVLVKESSQQEDIALLNLYVPNNIAGKCSTKYYKKTVWQFL